jgi:hypothetical protein
MRGGGADVESWRVAATTPTNPAPIVSSATTTRTRSHAGTWQRASRVQLCEGGQVRYPAGERVGQFGPEGVAVGGQPLGVQGADLLVHPVEPVRGVGELTSSRQSQLGVSL